MPATEGMNGLIGIVRHAVPIGNRMVLGVSGGPDSMALAWLLSQAGIDTLAITVDHGLRPESRDEAARIAGWLSSWPHMTHLVQVRAKPAQSTRIMERARADRYRLLTETCVAHGIDTLLTAHHRDDQAETLLFRLAKGSGLDGLAGMSPATALTGGVTLRRPLLDVPKAALVALCRENNVPFLDDPSNTDARFARPRLRQALADEGMTAARLAATAGRLGRARAALEFFTAEALDRAGAGPADRLGADRAILATYPDDIRVRAIATLLVRAAGGEVRLRLARVETLTEALFAAQGHFRATLHRCLVSFDPRTGLIKVEREPNA